MVRDLTSGNIFKHLVAYSIPLLLGNLFQLTYNAVDSIIVGKFAGMGPLAAVGAANPVMNIAILGINGFCIGASVLMSQFFGAGKEEELKKEFSTMVIFGTVFSLAVMVLGIFLSEPLLAVLQVPEDILESSALYLKIIFCGMPFTCLYNAYASAMRSVGDSKTPVTFLAFASVLNGVMDYVLIAGAGMGVEGAALATVTAEALSAVLCIWFVYRKIPMLQLKKEEAAIDKKLLGLTLQHGSITALQQACQPVGKLLIQGKINTLGISSIATFNAVSRVDDFAFTPEQNISHGMMTFTAQNRGAQKAERVREGFRTGMLLEAFYWIFICIVILMFKRPIMSLFSTEGETEMIELGAQYLTLMSFFYLLPAFTNGIQGFVRGIGDMKITLISTFIQIGVRVVFIYLLVPVLGLNAVAWASLIGWICMLIYEVPYYFRYKKENYRIVRNITET